MAELKDHNDRYRSEFRRGLVGLIAETGRAPEARHVLVSAEIVADELIYALAFVLHNSPEAVSPSARRALCDQLARKLQARIGAVKEKADAGLMPYFRTPDRGAAN